MAAVAAAGCPLQGHRRYALLEPPAAPTPPLPTNTVARLILLPLLLLMTVTVEAARLDLYRAELAVADQSESSRRLALSEALLQVLVRVSGDRSLAGDSAIVAATRNAETLLIGFQYRSVEIPAGELAPAARELRLVADFDPGAVQSLLRELSLPFWGSERPSILVWLFDADPVDPNALTDPADPRWFWLSEQAKRRGLPLVLPLFDLEDRRNMQPARLWAAGEQALNQSRQRYATALVLLAQPTTEGLRWRLLGDALDAGSIQPGPIEVALPALIDDLADLLGQRFAILPGERIQGSQRLLVEGIGSAADFARVMSYLAGLSAVFAVQPERAQGDRLLLRVELAAAPQRLRQQIAIGNVLRVVEAEGRDDDALRLRLLP